MSDSLCELKEQYASLLREYLAGGGEAVLLQAQALGHAAVAKGVGALQIAEIHHQAMLTALKRMPVSPEITQMIKLFTDFFMENLSIFEMIERGYLEANARLTHLGKILDYNQRFVNDIVAAVPAGLLVFNRRTAELIITNKTFCEKFRVEAGEVTGKSLPDILDLIGLPAVAKTAILTSKGFFGLECWSNSQRVGKLLLKISMINGRLEQEAFLLMIEDITERWKLEQEMARLERLNLIGEMAAGIGHEIRNPMTTVRGFLQLLANKKEYSQDKEFFTLMLEELDRVNDIISEFLSLARNRAVELKAQNLNDIVKAIYPLIQADAMRADNYCDLELEDVPDLLLNEKEIRQLILNLARNGLEAMSHLSVGKLTIRTYRDENEVVLAVQDQGKGIEPHILERLGTPFLTTKENGTGIGLSVCYSIANRHKARIAVDTSSSGTTVFVRFNLAKNLEGT